MIKRFYLTIIVIVNLCCLTKIHSMGELTDAQANIAATSINTALAKLPEVKTGAGHMVVTKEQVKAAFHHIVESGHFFIKTANTDADYISHLTSRKLEGVKSAILLDYTVGNSLPNPVVDIAKPPSTSTLGLQIDLPNKHYIRNVDTSVHAPKAFVQTFIDICNNITHIFLSGNSNAGQINIYIKTKEMYNVIRAQNELPLSPAKVFTTLTKETDGDQTNLFRMGIQGKSPAPLSLKTFFPI